MKILICTYAFARCDLIKLQFDCLKKFFKEEFEFIVFNNSQENHWSKDAITETCRQHGIRCERVKDRNDSCGSYSHGNALNYSLKNIILPEKPDHVLLIDFDMFLLKPFSFVEFMSDSDIRGVWQSKSHVNYIWPGLMFFKIANLQNINQLSLNCNPVDGINVDSGGELFNYLKANPQIVVKHFPHSCHINSRSHMADFFVNEIVDRYNPEFCYECYDRTWLHLGSGSNWNSKPKELVDSKTILLNEIVNRSLNGELLLKD